MRLVLAFNRKAEEFITPRSVMQGGTPGTGPSPQKSTYLDLARGCRPTKSHPLLCTCWEPSIDSASANRVDLCARDVIASAGRVKDSELVFILWCPSACIHNQCGCSQWQLIHRHFPGRATGNVATAVPTGRTLAINAALIDGPTQAAELHPTSSITRWTGCNPTYAYLRSLHPTDSSWTHKEAAAQQVACCS